MMRVVWIVLAVVAVAGSGCTGTSDAQPSSKHTQAPRRPTSPAPLGAAEGALAGVVLDDELVPIANATVSVVGDEASAFTDEDGKYLLGRLAPGGVRVQASNQGYRALALDATVVAGVVSNLNFTLERDLSERAYVAVYHRTGHLQTSSWAADQFVLGPTGLINTTCPQCALFVPLDDAPVQYLHEFRFEPTYSLEPAVPAEVCWHLHRNSTATEYSALVPGHIYSGCTEDGASQAFGNPEIQEWDRLFTLYLTGPDAPPAMDQRVDVWFSIAHGGPLPSGWTAMPQEA